MPAPINKNTKAFQMPDQEYFDRIHGILDRKAQMKIKYTKVINNRGEEIEYEPCPRNLFAISTVAGGEYPSDLQKILIERQELALSLMRIRLKELRLGLGLSFVKLAEVMQVSPQLLHFYENGKVTPPMWALIKLSIIYGVTLDYICGFSDEVTIRGDNLPLSYFTKIDNLEHIERMEMELGISIDFMNPEPVAKRKLYEQAKLNNQLRCTRLN